MACYDPLTDELEYSTEVLLHFRVREPEERDSVSFNIPLPFRILLLLSFMGRAVNFKNQHEFWAIEIHNILINWFLSMKVVAQHLFSP